MSVNTVDQKALKSAIIQLFEQDKEFLHKMASLFQIKEKTEEKKFSQDMDEEDEPKFDKLPQDMTDEEHAEFMKHIQKKYANKMSDLLPLRDLFKDELPAEELVKML